MMALGKRLEYREICRPTLSSMEIVPIPTTLLSLFMLHLLKLGQPIAEESEKQLGTKLGDGTWRTTKTAWAKLSPKVNRKLMAQRAPVVLSEDAEDAEAQTILTNQLETNQLEKTHRSSRPVSEPVSLALA